MRLTGKWLKKTMALVLSATMIFSGNYAGLNVKADTTLPEGAKQAVHLTAPIEDGVYRATINMMNANSTGQYSMGNAALRGSDSYNTNNPTDADHKQLVVVKDGKATAVVQFMPMGYIGTYGFMMELEGVNPDVFTKYGSPLESHTEYTETQTITLQKTQDGKIVYDTYNDPDSQYKFDGSDATAHKRPAGYGKEEQLINIVDKAYPSLLTVDVTPVTQEGIDLPTNLDEYDVKTAAYCHVFVPVMFSISPSSGDQYARLLVDWKNAEKVSEPENDLEYQLYRAMNVNTENASSEATATFTECKNEIIKKLENVWPAQHLDMDGTGFKAKPIINAKELTDKEKTAEAQKLNNAINAVEAGDTEETAWDGTTVKEPKKDGNTLYIGKASELAWLSQVTNNGDTTKYNVELTNDIDLNNKPWTRIATFTGNFNGNGHKIINLNISKEEGDSATDINQGLFKEITGQSKTNRVEIKNFSIEGNIKSNFSYTGSVAAKIKYVNVSNVTANVKIDALSNTGGLFGEVRYSDITDCKNLGNIIARGYSAGGITSFAVYTKITRCGNEGEINTVTGNVGGIVGMATVYSNYTDGVEECYNTGDITGTMYVGGVIGFYQTYGKSETSPVATVKNVYNTGDVTATYKTNGVAAGGIIGSLVGPAVTLKDSYSAGKITTEKVKGSAVGLAKNATLTNVYVLTNDIPLYNEEGETATCTVTNVEYKNSEWFASDEFKTAMGDNADKYEYREAYINRGVPVFKTQEDTIEVAVKEAKRAVERCAAEKDYQGLSKTAVENIVNEAKEKIEKLTDRKLIGQEVSGAEERIREIPNDVNYGLDLTILNERVEYAKSLDSSKYTEDTWKKVSAVLAGISYLKEHGFETQEKVNSYVDTLNANISNLEFTPEVKAYEEAKDNCNNQIKDARENCLDTTKYTEESVNELKSAIEKAEALLQQGNATKEAIDEATEEIKAKVAALVKKPEPTTEPATEAPTDVPTTEPTTEAPTTEPATEAPTAAPTTEPATEAPTAKPTTEAPTKANPTTKHQTKVKVATVKVKYAKNKKRKKLSLKWIKVKKVNGYQISYSTNKKFKKSVKTITLKNNVSKTNIKVKKGKKYYVRIRAYIKTKNGVVYGRWSKVKSTKIRK